MGDTKKETKKVVSINVAQARSTHILVAEDNKAIQGVVFRILDFMGFEVALAGNGVEALSLFLANPFDLVLTDLEMPIMDGWRLTHCIKEISPYTPVVLMTGGDRETFRKKVERATVDSVLFKPFRLEDLQRTVQEALASTEREHGNLNKAPVANYLNCKQLGKGI
jgi:two-component system capsular synthesis sensor histidine kinase RcsC